MQEVKSSPESSRIIANTKESVIINNSSKLKEERIK
jgi:hypothetical protein